MLTSVVTFALLAASLSLVLCALVRRVGLALISPRADRWHSVATPTMGGVGFATATLLATAATILASSTLPIRIFEFAVPLAGIAMLVLGVFDDRLQLSPLAKLVFSLIVGALIVFIIFASFGLSIPLIATLLAVVWFGGVVHALNLLDNMDGLAGGIALIAIGMLCLLFAPVLGSFIVIYLVCVAGSLIGFLYWNWKPARLFMGDSGSLFLGGTLAATSLVATAAPGIDTYKSAVLIILVLSVPLFDTGFVLVLRMLSGRKATRGGTDHISHRLVFLGFSERGAVHVLYLIGVLSGFIAIMVQRVGLRPMLPVAVLFAFGLVLMGVYLARIRAYDTEDFGRRPAGL